MKYIPTFESYKSQNELSLLSEKIIDMISIKTNIKYGSDSKLYDLESVKLMDINYNEFSEIKKFIIDFRDMPVIVTDNKGVEGYDLGGKNGVYLYNGKNRYIFINKLEEVIKGVNNGADLIGSVYKDKVELIEGKLNSLCKSTMIHELQHAFDDWRSKGKALKEPNEYINDKIRDRELSSKDISKLKEEELDFISKHYKDYLNLKHEVDARFTSAINDISFYDLDFDESIDKNKNVYVMNSFDKVKSDFKYKMGDYRFLNHKDRWRVLRKLGQFYEMEKDFVKKINSEQKEFD